MLTTGLKSSEKLGTIPEYYFQEINCRVRGWSTNRMSLIGVPVSLTLPLRF